MSVVPKKESIMRPLGYCRGLKKRSDEKSIRYVLNVPLNITNLLSIL